MIASRITLAYNAPFDQEVFGGERRAWEQRAQLGEVFLLEFGDRPYRLDHQVGVGGGVLDRGIATSWIRSVAAWSRPRLSSWRRTRSGTCLSTAVSASCTVTVAPAAAQTPAME
ncbi:hypothetical protein RERY_29630 [Rhodococcus erythropolis]|nr:hypothetical protein RERY_29630 [Rhodococcus erythropolis]